MNSSYILGRQKTMKILVILVAFMPFVWGTHSLVPAQGNFGTFSNQIIDAIESFKKQMPCGFDMYGIPPLAPYSTPHQKIAIDNENIQAFGEINDFRLNGLDDFEIVNLRMSAIYRRFTFEFNWNNIYWQTLYNITLDRSGKGPRRNGPAKFTMKDLTIWGQVKYNLGIVSGKLSIKELRVYVSLGEVKSEISGLSRFNIINKKLNRIIEEWFMIAVNDNTETVAEFTNNKVRPLLNDFLSDKRISDLLGLIGGGDGAGGSTEKEPCIPPGGF